MNKILHFLSSVCYGIATTAAAALFVACSTELDPGVSPRSEQLDAPEAVTFAATDTQRTLDITADCHWDATLADAWTGLTVSPLSGDAGQTLTVTTPANTTRQNRTATLTINSKGGITKTVTISQTLGDVQLIVEGGENGVLSFTETGGQQEFTITCNTQWTITGTADWLALSATKGTGSREVTAIVSEIQTDQDRSTTLTVSAEEGVRTALVVVKQMGKVISLDVTPTTLTFAALGGNADMTVTCNADWTCSASDDWLSLSTAAGTTPGGTVTATCGANTQPQPRTAIITFRSGTKVEPITVTLTQAAGTIPTVTTPVADLTSITKYTATVSFAYESAFPVTEYGIWYGTSPDPVANGICLSFTGSNQLQGSATVDLSGLASHTLYYIRAYARSTVGTAYSPAIATVTTLGDIPGQDDNPMPTPQ